MFRLVQEEGLFEPRRLDDIATVCSRGGWIVESRVRSGKEKENYYFSITNGNFFVYVFSNVIVSETNCAKIGIRRVEWVN